jgi:hypothetical protein
MPKIETLLNEVRVAVLDRNLIAAASRDAADNWTHLKNSKLLAQGVKIH